MTVSKESIAVASTSLLLLMFFQLSMLSSVPEKVELIHKANRKIIFARDSATRPETIPEAVMDRDINRSWKLNYIKPVSSAVRNYVPDEKSNFLQMELTITHFPGSPPVINPLKHIIIWPGYYEAGKFTKKYARPSTVRLVFFDQEMIDVDKEYRLPSPPSFTAEKTVTLPDREGPFSIDVDFLPEIKKSEKFPENIYQRWIRIEVLGIYSGNQYENEFSIAEMDYTSAINDHEQFVHDDHSR